MSVVIKSWRREVTAAVERILSIGARIERRKMAGQQISDATNLISVEMLRNALYSKWCNLAGKSLSQETNLTARRILESKKGKCFFAS